MAVAGFAQELPRLEIDRVDPAGDLVVRLGNQAAGTTWQLEGSSDLSTWEDIASGGVPVRFSHGEDWARFAREGTSAYFRTSQTASGLSAELYDVRVVRDVHLEFSQPDWQGQLKANFGTGINILADLTVDGVVYPGIGVRFRGLNSYIFTGSSKKKSFALSIDETDPAQRVMGFKTLNLNNAFSDASFMREVLFNNACAEYVPSPRASFVRLSVNGEPYGVYINAQQENRDLLKDWFDDPRGDRWRAGVGAIGSWGGRIDFGGSLRWEGPDRSDYDGYELKSGSSDADAAWTALILALGALHHTPEEDLPGLIDSVFAVDRWLWFFALDTVFLDSDGYLYKAGDYLLFRDETTGRFHPIQRDGNEAFAHNRRESTPALDGDNLLAARPLPTRLFAIPEYRQRYLAHLRTLLQRTFTIEKYGYLVDTYAALIRAEVEADPIKLSTLASFDSETGGEMAKLKAFIRDRRAFLLADPEVDVPSPVVVSVVTDPAPVAGTPATVSVVFDPAAVPVRAATLFHVVGDSNREFSRIDLTDEGGGSFMGEIPAVPAGTTVFYYVEGEADDGPGTRVYHPVLAEAKPLSFQVAPVVASSTDVVINEFMASNDATLSDPQGQFDDWVELRNLSGEALDVGGMFLSDNPANLRKWQIPAGTVIPGDGFLIIWCDEDGQASAGLHASFKLSAAGESLRLSDSDARGNVLLDSVDFGLQQTDVSTGRPGSDPDTFAPMAPSPGGANSG